MDPQGLTIFKKVAVSERKSLFRELAQAKTQITLKNEEDKVFHLTAIQCEKDENLLCHHTVDSKDIQGDHKVLVNFMVGNERYFFQSDLSFESGWAVLKINTDIFLLQRRANARVDLPEGYEASFTITNYLGKAYFHICKLKDISAGGFKTSIEGFPKLKLEDELKGSLRLGSRRPIEVTVQIRFATEVANGSQQIIGAQILNISPGMESRLLILMMDLQRELFLKYSK